MRFKLFAILNNMMKSRAVQLCPTGSRLMPLSSVSTLKMLPTC